MFPWLLRGLASRRRKKLEEAPMRPPLDSGEGMGWDGTAITFAIDPTQSLSLLIHIY